MESKYKVAIGFSAFLILFIWAMRTKNEVVAGIVFPLKVKLGMAQPNLAGTSQAGVDAPTKEVEQILAEIKEKMPLGYVPADKIVTGGHVYYGQFGDELQKLWRLGYSLTPSSNDLTKYTIPKLVKISPEEQHEMIELHRDSAIGFKNAQEQLQDKFLFSGKYPDVIGVGRVKIGLGDGFEIAVLKGADHTKTLAALSERKYGGYPIQILEREMTVAQ